MKNFMKFCLLLLLTAPGFTVSLFAAGSDMESYIDTAFIVFFVFLLFLSLFFLFSHDREEKKSGEATLWKLFMQKLNDGKAVDEEHEVMLDHDYDGIKELDNNLPPWWKWLFYVTIIFSAVYMLHYHVLDTGELQEQEYVTEMQEAARQKAEFLRTNEVIDASTVTLLTGDGDIALGKEIYAKNCVACHLADGGGSVGPNLTDDFWIHGGSVKDVFVVVTEGVPAKGMISWKNQLTPKQIQQVSSFVLSLQGTTPATPKKAEGEKYVTITGADTTTAQ